jgi:4-amino-4-deoxy-L-arabinose transferase-like glycosyltransferase
MFDLWEIFQAWKKKFSKIDLVIIFGLILLYLATRLVRLDQFPIFTDEGIYIHWAKIAWHDASWRFISLTDGKQPLQTWATIPFLKLFPNNLLLAGRLFSVTTGFISLIGIFCLLFYLFNKRTAFIGSFFYILTPYFLFYDRMALTDSAVNTGFIWILFFSIVLIKTLRLDVTLIFGLVAGLALLTKSSAQMFVALSFLAPIILIVDSGLKKNFKKIINFIFLYAIVFILSFSIYNIQRLSPFIHYIGTKNTTFLMTFNEFIKAPFSMFLSNFRGVVEDIFWESGWLLPFFSFLGLISLFKKDKGLFYYLSLWFLIPFFVICFISKIIFPRYLIFFASLLVIFASVFISHQRKNFFILLMVLFSVFYLYLDYPILYNFEKISFPPIDRGQYIEGPAAGWGVREILDFARKKSKEKTVIILAEGNFGLIGDMLEASLRSDDNISVRGYWPLNEETLWQSKKELEKNYVYAVFPHRSEFPGIWPIKLIKKYEKPGGKSAIYFFELIK